MLKRVAAASSPIPRAPKRQRRTATAVLAGYFDPRPLRDYFTDMANNNSGCDALQRPYNSIVGHGPGVLFDIRPQDEKDQELAQERKRLLKNARRRERDLEKRKGKQETWLKKFQRRVLHPSADAISDNRADDVQRVAPPSPPAVATDDSLAQLPSGSDIDTPCASSTNYSSSVDDADHLSHLATHSPAGSASGSGWCHWSPRHGYAAPATAATSTNTFTNTELSPSLPSRVAFPYDDSYMAATARPDSGPVQPPHLGGNRASAVSGVTLDVSMTSLPLSSPSTALTASPPTPSQSISSITSHTSSKRPHTPADDEDDLMHDLMSTPSHAQGHAHRSGGVHGAEFDDTYSPLELGDQDPLEHNNTHNTPVKGSSVFNSFTPTRVAPHFNTPMMSPRRVHESEPRSGLGSAPRTPMDHNTHTQSAAGSPYASPAAERLAPQPQSPMQVPYTPVTAHAQAPSTNLGTGYSMAYSGSNTGSFPSVATTPYQNVQSTPSPVTPSSTAHRRNALSVAALLSPPSPIWSYTNMPERSVPLAPIAEGPDHADITPRDSSTPALRQGRIEAAGDGVGDGLGDQIPEPSVAASSTVEESCLSPMMGIASPSLVSGEKDLLAASAPPVGEAQSLDAAMMDIVREDGAVTGEPGKETREEFAAPKEKTTVLGPAIQLSEGVNGYGSLKNLSVWKGARENSESATPVPGREARKWGRASKAMMIFQSEDELTELDDWDGGDEDELDELEDDDDDDFELRTPRGRRSKGKGKGVKGGRKGAKGRGRGMSMTGRGGSLSVRGQSTLSGATSVVVGIDVAGPSIAQVNNASDNVTSGITPAVTEKTNDIPTSVDDAVNVSSAVSADGNAPANPKKRKRQAVKKGWKGWVEVEVGDVDEEEEMRRFAPKQFRMEELTVRERRTRSGRQFDA